MSKEIETKFVARLVSWFGSKRISVLERAAVFDKFIGPNKNFTECGVMIEAADGLADALEKEISRLKAGVDPDRDEKLAAARAYKKTLRGFCTHAYKQ